MSGTNLVVKISAADKFSKAFGVLKTNLSGAGHAVGTFAKDSGTNLARMSKAVTHLGGSAAKAGAHMTEALAPLGILTGALSAAGFGKMVSDWARFSQSLSFNAARIGVGVSQLQALEGSAQLAGSSASAAAGGLQNLQDTMTDTVGGRNMEALVYFRQLGVAFQDGAGHALRATAVLPKLADAIARIKDPSLQARVATQFFGGATESLLPWLRRGSAGMAEYAALAKHYGVETDDSTEKAGLFRFAQERLVLAFKGLGNSISEEVSPPLSKMMTFLAELVARNRGLIADKFGSWAKQLGDWIESIDWAKTAKYFGDLFDRFERWTDAMSKFTVPAWMKKLFGLGDESPSPAGGTPSGNGPLTDDNPNAPGSPAFYKAHPEIKPPRDPSFFRAPKLPPFGGFNPVDPRGIRNNNPLNLSYVPGQGATGSDGRFGVYGSMEDGIAASTRQLVSYGDSGTDTIRKIISRWSPPSDGNDTEAYIKRVSGVLGIDENKRIDMHDPNMLNALETVMARQETGRQLPYDVVQRGVNEGLGNGNPLSSRMNGVSPNQDVIPPDNGNPLRRYMNGVPDDAIDTPLRSRLEAQSRHEVVIRVQAAPGTQASATATGSGAASVLVEHSMAPPT